MQSLLTNAMFPLVLSVQLPRACLRNSSQDSDSAGPLECSAVPGSRRIAVELGHRYPLESRTTVIYYGRPVEKIAETWLHQYKPICRMTSGTLGGRPVLVCSCYLAQLEITS